MWPPLAHVTASSLTADPARGSRDHQLSDCTRYLLGAEPEPVGCLDVSGVDEEAESLVQFLRGAIQREELIVHAHATAAPAAWHALSTADASSAAPTVTVRCGPITET